MNRFWRDRISAANADYKSWSNRFKCDVLEEYYEGKQWRFNSFFTSEPYIVNLVYSTIKIKAANILLSYPKYLITPKPGNADYSQEIAIQSAQIKEDVVNTTIENDREAFSESCHLVFLDSMFRFGVMEVGYAADWVRNPLAGRPLLNSQVTVVGEESKTVESSDIKISKHPDELPDNEKIYFKRIQANRFRVGTRDAQELSRCDWIGYYDFIRRADLKVIKNIKSEYLSNALPSAAPDAPEKGIMGMKDERGNGDIIKVWHAFDFRAMKRYLIFDSPCEVVWEDDISRNPIMDLRWDLRLKGWYPMPPVFNWLSPQNEYNECREMQRSHRKRFIRKFQVIGEEIEQEEIDKFTNGEDGTLVKVPRADAIKAIENPALDATAAQSTALSKDDFNEVSGTSSADRGRADRTTATESQRLGLKADIRDSAEQGIMKKFYVKLAREALLCAQERFVEGTWAKLTVDPGENMFDEVQTSPAYQWITSEQIDDGYDFKVGVEVVSDSPVVREEEEKAFAKFLTYTQTYPQIAMSPILVREAAYRCGYRNERIIKEMQKMATLNMMGQISQAQAQQQQTAPVGAAQTQAAQMTPPNAQQLQNQTVGQLQ